MDFNSLTAVTSGMHQKTLRGPGQRLSSRLVFGSVLCSCACRPLPKTKKADVAEHQEVFDHVGLLTNEPPGSAEFLFI
jgi:hypothetical protein